MKVKANVDVVCLTLGQEYEVLEEVGSAYKIINNNHVEGYYYKRFFDIVEENKTKEITLNQDSEHDMNKLDDLKTPEYYDNTKGSLYQFAEQQKLNSYEFDMVKRIVRSRKKGNFIEDLEKTKLLIDLYIKEYDCTTDNSN